MTYYITSIVVVVAVFVVAFTLANRSHNEKPLGLIDGHLSACPNKPNCVCSEPDNAGRHAVNPVPLEAISGFDEKKRTLDFVVPLIEKLGGHVTVKQRSYIAAEFESRFMGFVDDLELRLDMENGQLQLRSSSRVGYSDMGVNRKRVEALTRLLTSQ